MIKFSDVSALTKDIDDNSYGKDNDAVGNFSIPENVDVFEITGPLFFGAAYKFKDAMKYIENPAKVLIIRMRQVPIIDATGIRTLKDVYDQVKHRGTKLILSEVHSEQVMAELKNSRLLFAVGKANVTDTFSQALERSNSILQDSTA